MNLDELRATVIPPGHLVVLHSPNHLDFDQVNAIQRHFDEAMPDMKGKVVVLSPGYTIEALPRDTVLFIRHEMPLDVETREQLADAFRELAPEVPAIVLGADFTISADDNLPTLGERDLFDIVAAMRRAPSAQDAVALLRKRAVLVKR